MTNEQAVGAGVRVAGAVLVLSMFGPLLQLIPLSIQIGASRPFWLLTYALQCVPLAALGLLMIAKPSQFSRWILQDGTHLTEATGWSLEELQAVLFSVLGLYFMVITVTDLYGWLRIFSNFSGNVRSVHWPATSDLAFMATTTLKLAVGVWLLLGARGVAAVIQRLRSR